MERLTSHIQHQVGSWLPSWLGNTRSCAHGCSVAHADSALLPSLLRTNNPPCRASPCCRVQASVLKAYSRASKRPLTSPSPHEALASAKRQRA